MALNQIDLKAKKFIEEENCFFQVLGFRRKSFSGSREFMQNVEIIKKKKNCFDIKVCVNATNPKNKGKSYDKKTRKKK